MSWTDRLKEAAYTSPSGVRLLFQYQDVRQAIDKKTSGFDFPDADGTFVQDTGHSGRRFPLRVFFWGADYDLEADAFEAILLERGIGRLEHPIYGTRDVVPFGTITRRDNLKTAANQAIVELVFWESIGLVFPTTQADPAQAVVAAVDEFNDAQATEFVDAISLDSTTEKVTFQNDYLATLATTRSALQVLADTQDDVRAQFNAIMDSIEQGITALVADPLALAFQTSLGIQAPARALTSIQARLDAYRSLAANIVGQGNAANSNEFRSRDLFASTQVTGSILSTVNNQFTTKTGALEAADDLLDQMEIVTNWRDDNFENLRLVDTGAAYQQLQEAVALTAGFLVSISFSLKQERRIVLTRARTIVDLAAELYGSVDDQLDFLINTNSLTGSEILELPKGREIVYYI